jgi:4-amino-4-deoxy-L-arabinose transferase-like glycosyltransferase
MNNEEPSVLDYLKSLLTPWKGPAPRIPSAPPTPEPGAQKETQPESEQGETITTHEITPTVAVTRVIHFPWVSFSTFLLALLGQFLLEPRPNQTRTWETGLLFYLLAAGGLIWANIRNEWVVFPLPDAEKRRVPETVRFVLFLVSIPLALIAYWSFKGNVFTPFNLFFWILALFFLLRALWLGDPQAKPWGWLTKLSDSITHLQWNLRITRWTLVFLAAAGLVIFFRVYQINQVPPEMVSDHAEKLLDVWDVLHGQPHIFFPRNTGREAIQMYLTAAIVKYIGTGFSFLSLKIGTILAGLLILPFIYLLGKEVGNRRVGLLAMVFTGIAYWPNVISRVGLRFPLYPLFVAPTLYFLFRGLRTSNRNDFILAGLALGIGLHGYTPIRILPVIVVIAFGLYLVHRQSSGHRKLSIGWLAVVVLVSGYIFIPLARYSQENPELFNFRTFTRLGTEERPLPGPAGQIFVSNLWRAMTMFAWDDGEIWVHSVTHRPALDTISAALFYIGMFLLFIRYLRRRNWLDLFLVLSVPLLMMPSILSLAFPAENPALNRAGGAVVTVFIIVAIALDGFLNMLENGMGSTWGPRAAWTFVIILVVLSAGQNYDLVFNQYFKAYQASSWNTSEMGQVIHDFAGFTGTSDSAWVVAYPYWVDTRLVGMNADVTTRDFAIWPEQLQSTLVETRPKLFLVNLEDQTAVQTLRELYPQGYIYRYPSRVGKDFLVYLVGAPGEAVPALLQPAP